MLLGPSALNATETGAAIRLEAALLALHQGVGLPLSTLKGPELGHIETDLSAQVGTASAKILHGDVSFIIEVFLFILWSFVRYFLLLPIFCIHNWQIIPVWSHNNFRVFQITAGLDRVQPTIWPVAGF